MAGITKRTRESAAKAERAALRKQRTTDSFQNFQLNLGIGTDNALSGSTYGFNPITRNRTLLEWIHRGSWLGGMAVDLVADDMTRAGIDIICDAKPEDIDAVQQCLVRTGTWQGVNDTAKWNRLYGGAIGVMQIDGQNYETPLNPDRIGKGQFRGVIALDRWMVEPSLNDLVSELGPQLGCPKFYRVTSDIPGFKFKTIHYSRVIRLDGIRLPYWQRVSENLWGISVLERLYDRMVAFDSATTGIAQLAYKSYIRTYKIEGLREIIAEGGTPGGAQALMGLMQYVDMMRRFQSIEGMTLMDSKDEFEANSAVNMAGMSDALLQFAQQISGSLQIPLVRMLGQSPAGLNSTGESDLRTYYDGINQKQNNELLVPMTTLVRAASLSEGRALPPDFTVRFRPLWQLSEEQKSEVSARDTDSIIKAEAAGIATQKTAMKELKTVSQTTGRWSNITDEEIEESDDTLAPRGQDAIDQEREAMSDRDDTLGGEDEGEEGSADQTLKKPRGFKDSARTRDSLPISELHGIPVAIETLRGTIRRGDGWSVVMPADYGYVRRAPSAEGPEEWMDCFLGPDRASRDIHVVDGYTPDGAFDEHKCMMAFSTAREALACYHQAYHDGRRAGSVTTMTPKSFMEWCATGDVTRPLGERNLRLAAGDIRVIP